MKFTMLNNTQEMLEKIGSSIDDKELSVFCGAGVSVPSGIPMVKSIIYTVFEGLGIPKQKRNTLYKRIMEGYEENGISHLPIPFEQFMEIFLKARNFLDKGLINNEKVADLCKIFLYQNGKGLEVTSSVSHHIWAELFDRGMVRFITTTNFDRCFERALQWDNDNKNIIYNNFDKVDKLNGKLFKIHGSATDTNSVMITIQSLNHEHGFALSNRNNLIKGIFSKDKNYKSLLFIGYSFSDIFDIVPMFQSIPQERELANIYVWQHVDNKLKRTNESEHTKLNKLLSNYNNLNNVFLVPADTKELNNYLLDKFKIGFNSQRELKIDKVWQSGVLKSSLLSNDKEWLKSQKAHFYYRIKDLDKSYEEYANILMEAKDPFLKAVSYGNQAGILYDWGKLKEAMALHKKEEVICKELGDKSGLARSYCNQALILYAWGQLEEAMVLHKKQEVICKELGNKSGLAVSYGNQAGILKAWGNLKKRWYYTKSKKLFVKN